MSQSLPKAYDPQCRTDSAVFVNGVRVPVGSVDVFMRTEGVLDFTRYCEGTFASPFRGEDYASLFQGLRPDEQDNFDTVQVYVLDHTTDKYYLQFHGMVTGVGNTADGPEREWHFRAQSPGHFLSKIRANSQFEKSSGFELIKHVANRLSNKLPYEISAEDTEGTPVIQESKPSNNAGETTDNFVDLGDVLQIVFSSKSFQKNKHTLADVLDWTVGKSNVRTWLTPTTQGAAFVATREPATVKHQGHYLGGDTKIIENDAVIELKPANTIAVNGRAQSSLRSQATFGVLDPPKQYARAKVRHQSLYERAGKTELHADVDSVVDGETKEEVVNEAKRILSKRIENATQGDMKTMLRGPVTPMDTIEAKPTCNARVQTNASPITYEIRRVHHAIRGKGMSTTRLNVGVKVNGDELEVVDSWEEDI